MISIKKSLFVLITISSLRAPCPEECLKCGTDNNCILCNSLDFYIVSEKTCKKST